MATGPPAHPDDSESQVAGDPSHWVSSESRAPGDLPSTQGQRPVDTSHFGGCYNAQRYSVECKSARVKVILIEDNSHPAHNSWLCLNKRPGG